MATMTAVEKHGTRNQRLEVLEQRHKGMEQTKGRRLRQSLGQRFKTQSKIHNDYENDVVEIPVVKKICFKFNRPTKLEFV